MTIEDKPGFVPVTDSVDVSALRKLCQELLDEVRSLRAEVTMLRAERPVYVPMQPVYPSWPMPTWPQPGWPLPIVTCGIDSTHSPIPLMNASTLMGEWS